MQAMDAPTKHQHPGGRCGWVFPGRVSWTHWCHQPSTGDARLPTELLPDGVVPVEVQQVRVDVGELLEGQKLQHA